MSDSEIAARRRLKTTLLAIALLLATFATGFIAGLATGRLVMRRPPGGMPPVATRAMVHRLDKALGLNDDQQRAVEEILRRRHQRMNELWRGVRPQVRAEIDATNEEIAKVLTPEQRKKFESLKLHMRSGDGPGRRHRRHD